MKHLALLVAACTVAIGCEGKRDPATSPATTVPGPTYALSGTVRDSAGAPIFGATVVLMTAPPIEQFGSTPHEIGTTTTDAAGFFKFMIGAGTFRIQVSRDEYGSHVITVKVASDMSVGVTISKVLLSDTIQLGRTIRSAVSATAAPCDPYGWDARAPCRRFYFTVPTAGVLSTVITWSGPPELDATLVTPAGAYLANSRESGFERVTMSAVVNPGVTYELRVNAYYGGQWFNLAADFVPYP